MKYKNVVSDDSFVQIPWLSPIISKLSVTIILLSFSNVYMHMICVSGTKLTLIIPQVWQLLIKIHLFSGKKMFLPVTQCPIFVKEELSWSTIRGFDRGKSGLLSA